MIITIAEWDEMKLVKELMPDFNGKVIVTGVGMMNACMALCMLPKSETILNIGYAGSNKIPVGTFVKVTEVQTAHRLADFNDRRPIGTKFPAKYVEAPCYTCTDFVTEWNGDEPAVFDMELAGIASLGFKEVMSIKKVSDTLNYEQFKEETK